MSRERTIQLSPSLREMMEMFEGELSLSKSELTCEAYGADVARFLEFAYSKGVKSAKRIQGKHVIDWLKRNKAQGKSGASINRYYMALRCFFKCLLRAGEIEVDPCAMVVTPKYKQKTPFVPQMGEMARLLALPDPGTETGTRDRAMLELLYSSGLRATELCELELEDFKGAGVVIKCGKRGKGRTVPITGESARWIADYVQRWRGDDPGYLFVTLMGRQIRRQLLSRIVQEYAAKAGMAGVTAHTLRHACATHLLDQGADLRMIQEVLGHSSIASTQRYTHLSGAKVEEMFNKFHPRRSENE